MKHNVPRENQPGYAHALVQSIRTFTSTKDWEYGKFSDSDLDEVITALEITYDNVKRMLNIRQ